MTSGIAPSPDTAWPGEAGRPVPRRTVTRQEMLDGPIVPVLMRLALPTIGVLMAQTAVSVVETVYVGFLGTDALAGVALVFPVLMLMTMMSAGGIGGGVASAVARAVGDGRPADADALVAHALALAVVLGLLFTVVLLAFGGALYGAMGGTGATLEAAVVYGAVVFAGAIPVWIVNLMSAALRGAGNVRVPALVTLAGAVLLVPLSPLLIFGVGPVEGLGVAGAGLAVTAYYWIAAGFLLRYLATGRAGLTLRRVRLERRLIGDILGVGLLAALSTVQLNLTVVLVTGAVGLFGADALAGYGMASRLDYLMIPILFGLGTAVISTVGTNVGAGQILRARRIAWVATGIAAGFTGTVGLLATLFPGAWIALFSADPAVIAAGSAYLVAVGPVYAGLGAIFTLTFVSQGGGRPLPTLLAGTARLAVAAGLGWIAVAWGGAGLSGLYLIVAASILVSAAACTGAALGGLLWRGGRG